MIFLSVLAVYLSMGVIGLFLTYHNRTSPFYGRLTVETILLGLLLSPGIFISEVFELIGKVTGFQSDYAVFKRKSK